MKDAVAPLAFRPDGSLTLLRASDAVQLRDLLAALVSRFGAVHVCTDAREALALAPRAVAVLVGLSRESWEALNLARPFFYEQQWTVFLWCDPPALELAESVGADLYDWRSNSVDVPSEPPWWAIEDLLACEKAESNCEWRGERLDECVARAWSGRAVRRLDARTEYEKLLAAIEAAKDDFIAFEHVDSERELWRARWALAERKRKTGCALVDVGDGVVSWGWWRLHASPMAWSEAIERLRAAGDPEPGLTAGWCGLEPEAIAWAVRERAFGRESFTLSTTNVSHTDRSDALSIEDSLFRDGLQVSESLCKWWYFEATTLGLNDVAGFVAQRALVSFDSAASRFWFADALMNQGLFQQAIVLVDRIETSFSKALNSDSKLRALLGSLRATAWLVLGLYSKVIGDRIAPASLRYAAIARSLDLSALPSVFDDKEAKKSSEGSCELAIAFPGVVELDLPPSLFDWLRLDAVGSYLVDETPAELIHEVPLGVLIHQEYARALTHLSASRALHRYGFSQHALDHAVLARTLFLSLFGPSHHFVGRAYLAEGRALFARGEWSSARDTFALAIASLDASVEPEHPDTHEARFEHAWTRRFLREEDTSAALREHYAAIITRVPETHPRLRMLAERIDLPPDLAFVPNRVDARDP